MAGFAQLRLGCRCPAHLTGVVPIILAMVVGGCSSGGRPPVETQIVPYTQEQLLARESAKEARYRLRNGDHFSVAFKYEPELDVNNVLVLPDGYIALKGLSHPVRAAGATVEELDQTLETAYAAEFRNPDLSVLVLELAAPEVYVLGAVRLPGLYKLPEKGRGVLQAVAMAGGFQSGAKQSQVVLMRATDQGFLTRRYDLSDVADQPLFDLALFDLEPYDIVYVPKTGLSEFAETIEFVFGSAVKVSKFFWDIYALTNLDKIQTIIR